jgi:hypothetical protein
MNTCKECGSNFHTPRYATIPVCDFCLDGVPPMPESVFPRGHVVSHQAPKKSIVSSVLKYSFLIAVFAVIGKVGIDRYNELPPVPELAVAAPVESEVFEKNKALFLAETREKCASAVDQGIVKNISKADCLCVSEKLFTKLEAETDVDASGSFEKGFSEGQRIFAEHSDKILEECADKQEHNISSSAKETTHL